MTPSAILLMLDSMIAWWGYAAGDRTLVGVVVVVVVIAAVGFLLRRFLEHRRTRIVHRDDRRAR